MDHGAHVCERSVEVWLAAPRGQERQVCWQRAGCRDEHQLCSVSCGSFRPGRMRTLDFGAVDNKKKGETKKPLQETQGAHTGRSRRQRLSYRADKDSLCSEPSRGEIFPPFPKLPAVTAGKQGRGQRDLSSLCVVCIRMEIAQRKMLVYVINLC